MQHDRNRNRTDTSGQTRARLLEQFLGRFDRVVVGYSGGVDSTVVAVAATRALGQRARSVTAVTETLTPDDRSLARQIAASHELHHEEVVYDELAIEGYAENRPDRCYLCKSALYDHLGDLLGADDSESVVCDGTHAGDAGDYRPGRRAAGERRVVSPLAELGFDKEDVRAIARYYRLPNHAKPSAPCLSSRVPYGTTITREILDRIGEAERIVRGFGLTEFRVRHHDDLARIEVLREEFPLLLEHATEIERALQQIGYRFVALDLGGFVSGSLNRVLTTIEVPERK